MSQLLKIEADYSLEIRYHKFKTTKLADIDDLGDNEFVIRVSKKCAKLDLPKVIGHEMVHLRQYVTGQMQKMAVPGVCMWGTEFHIMQDDADDYFLSPWEMEARAYEAWLEYRWDHR